MEKVSVSELLRFFALNDLQRNDGIIHFVSRLFVQRGNESQSLETEVQVIRLPGELVFYFLPAAGLELPIREFYRTSRYDFYLPAPGELGIEDVEQGTTLLLLPISKC